MKKPLLFLPIACSIPVLVGCNTLSNGTVMPDAALRIEPTQRVRHSKNFARDYYQLGRFYQGQNRLDKATEAYRQALEIHADHVDAQNALATIYSKQGRFDEAIALFNTILKSKPHIARVYNNLGYTYFLQDKSADAVAAFEKSLKLEPNNPRTHNNLGAAYRKLGDEEKALLAFARASELATPAPASSDNDTKVAAATVKPAEPTPSATASTPKVVSLYPDVEKIVTLHAAGTPPTILTFSPAQSMLAQAPLPQPTYLTALIQETTDSGSTALSLASATSEQERQPQDEPKSSLLLPFMALATEPAPSQKPDTKEPSQAIEPKMASLPKRFQLEVSNGNGIAGLARKTRTILMIKGFPTAQLTNSKPYQQKVTVVQYRSGYHDQALALSQNFKHKPLLVQNDKLRQITDVKLVLGKDVTTQMALFEASEDGVQLSLGNSGFSEVDG